MKKTIPPQEESRRTGLKSPKEEFRETVVRTAPPVEEEP